jgi:hypothetical protein
MIATACRWQPRGPALVRGPKVGISATGEADANELYPNEHLPAGIDKTAIELYREFREDPASFFA